MGLLHISGGGQRANLQMLQLLLLLSLALRQGFVEAARSSKPLNSGFLPKDAGSFVEEVIAPIEQFGAVGRQLLGDCTDPSSPNACYAPDGSFAICCPGQCGPSSGNNPSCGRYGVDPSFDWSSTSAKPMSTSGQCPSETPNPCFTADSSAGFCCGSSGCGPASMVPVCYGDRYQYQTASIQSNPPANPPSNPTPSAPSPTDSPTNPPSNPPTDSPTNPPTNSPTDSPTNSPTDSPTNPPTNSPTNQPTNPPTSSPTSAPAAVVSNPTPNPTTATVNPGDKRTFVIHNNCPQTLWVGIFWNADKTPATLANTGQATTGFELGSQASAGVLTSSDWIGRFWARTNCGGSPFHCETGDCGGGVPCSGRTGEPPASLAEFALSQANGQDFYDASLVDGYNLKIAIKPSNPVCATVGCNQDLLATCPQALQMMSSDGSQVVGCYSACSAPSLANDPLHNQYCCSGQYAEDAIGCQNLHPDQYTRAFKDACPSAYSYAYDDPTSLFACNLSNYDIYFCGDVQLSA